MIFGRLPIDEAEGAILAHAVDTGDGKLLRKGHIVSAADIAGLKANNIANVLAARLEPGDMAENDAAKAIGDALTGAHITVKPPFTGRANLFSSDHGVVRLNEDLLHKINHVDESLTIATMANHDMVSPEQMLATIKIIPFAAEKRNVDKILDIIAQSAEPLIDIAPFQQRKIGVISTKLPQTRASVISKSEKILEDRLISCQNRIQERLTLDHHETELAGGITHLMNSGCDMVLIFGASAITDRKDVVPTAILETGGVIDHFGMPVDPGNLLLLGHNGPVDIIGLPGCTRSPKLNGFDWVLQRRLARIDVTASDIMAMGSGGLLKEISSRPQPRNIAPSLLENKSVAILILAAGQSRRMGRDNKLLAEIDGKPMFRHVAEQALNSTASGVFAVTGHERDKIEKVIEDLDIKTFHNPDFAEGLSSSLKTGFRALSKQYDGILVCLGDMPFVKAELFNQLINAFDVEEGRSIIVPTYQGKRGNPVLIASLFAADVTRVTGDIGAKSLIAENEHVVFNLDINAKSIFTDIDTPEALVNLQQRKDVAL
ncbi:molybdopterin-binding/glycosyltransferase family 2 protein [Sneathiella marina]|uniref:Molybdopterin-binding/glycosyltransferase family 2 protein n=1 Tax=Sneathiella marina TaxID=2950108 RepID=A0ABY4VY19_9PROT|nr:molybdopterin-binding/glycosyltransferase family 2 protein [Sneathiella marina]USG59718.1 molybdopterin-binding/glycosyltransferase family 2 protein [Sneathiella marina]